MKNWIEYLKPILKDYKDGDKQPLTLEDVDELVNTLKAKINLNEGNISEKQYDSILDTGATRLKALENASHYLCDGEATIEQQVDLIILQGDIDGTIIVDNAHDSIIVWEPLTDRYTVNEFLEIIGLT